MQQPRVEPSTTLCSPIKDAAHVAIAHLTYFFANFSGSSTQLNRTMITYQSYTSYHPMLSANNCIPSNTNELTTTSLSDASACFKVQLNLRAFMSKLCLLHCGDSLEKPMLSAEPLIPSEVLVKDCLNMSLMARRRAVGSTKTSARYGQLQSYLEWSVILRFLARQRTKCT
eukprot:363817-Amphidinium_carterae.1